MASLLHIQGKHIPLSLSAKIEPVLDLLEMLLRQP